MKCKCVSMNDMGCDISTAYRKYREQNQILCNYIMSCFDGWQVYMTEHDVNVFKLNFCSERDRRMDTSFLLTKEQLENIKCTLEEIIIPTLVHIEEKHCECNHN